MIGRVHPHIHFDHYTSSYEVEDAHVRWITLRAPQRSKRTTSAPGRGKREEAASSCSYHQGERDPSSRSALQCIDHCSRSLSSLLAQLFRALLGHCVQDTMLLPLVFAGRIGPLVSLFANTARRSDYDSKCVMKCKIMPSQVAFPIPVIQSLPLHERVARGRSLPATECLVALIAVL